MRIWAVGFALLVLGCAGASRRGEAPRATTLEPGAEYVELVDFVSDDQLAKYDTVRIAECRLGRNFASLENNLTACENALRNEALTSDASIAWVKPGWRKLGEGSGCENCVELKAMLLTPKRIGRHAVRP